MNTPVSIRNPYKIIVYKSLYLLILFRREHNGNATTTLLFCVISTIAPYITTTKCDFIVLSQVNEISLTVNEFYEPLMFLLTVNNYY